MAPRQPSRRDYNRPTRLPAVAIWREVREDLGVPDITTHSFRKTLGTLIDEDGQSARVGAGHLGRAKVSMTRDRYMARGRVHRAVADMMDRAKNGEQTTKAPSRRRGLSYLCAVRVSNPGPAD